MTEAAKATIVAVLKAHQPHQGTCSLCGEPLPGIREASSTEAVRDAARRHVADVIVKLLSLDQPPGRTVPSRVTDLETSHKAAGEIRIKAGTQRTAMLQAFHLLGTDGGTDEEAMMLSDVVHPASEYAKRASELREAGFIVPTGETRKGGSGMDRIVSRITDPGRTALARAGLIYSTNVLHTPGIKITHPGCPACSVGSDE